jgi:hypothetical protein
VLVLAALVVLASPRHRTFYFRGAAAPGHERSPRLDPPSLPGATAVLPVGAAARGPVAAIATRRQVLAADADGLKIPVSDDPPFRLPADGVPSGWELREFAGRAQVVLVRGEGGPAIQLRSERASFALYRDIVVSLDEFPMLAWSWKVTRLPAGGDVRAAARDDQAAQVYVVFPRWPSPRTNSDVIGYVWDTTAPVGTTVPSPRAPNVRIIVVASGATGLGAWQHNQRNVAEDYRALFGRRPPRVGMVALMIDTNDTGTIAEATMGRLLFTRATQRK